MHRNEAPIIFEPTGSHNHPVRVISGDEVLRGVLTSVRVNANGQSGRQREMPAMELRVRGLDEPGVLSRVLIGGVLDGIAQPLDQRPPIYLDKPETITSLPDGTLDARMPEGSEIKN